MRRSDLEGDVSSRLRLVGVDDKYLFFRRIGVREGIESRMHLNIRPQIRHILTLGLGDEYQKRGVASRLIDSSQCEVKSNCF